MKREQYISLALLAALLIFTLEIPFGNAAIVIQGNEVVQGSLTNFAIPTLQGAFYYHANPVTVDFDRYTGDGFLYNMWLNFEQLMI